MCNYANARSLYLFLGNRTWEPKFNKGRKTKTNVFYKNKKLPSVTHFGKLNIESEHINTLNITKKQSWYSNLFKFLSILRFHFFFVYIVFNKPW